ncbi:MAG: arginine--tRNA ligase [Phycisphaerae bacterium]
MKSIAGQLNSLFSKAIERAFGDHGLRTDPMIRPAADEQFGDYQSNVAMSLAKRLGSKPREVAQRIVDALTAEPQAAAMCEPFEIAGPGFINIRLRPEWIADVLNAVPPAGDRDRLGIDPAENPQTVVVDYSSPNIAKQMHVGHLRSTIIGDTIARILEFEGHRVIRQNHVGDWGTQFGMLCAYLKEKMPDALANPADVHLADLESFYKQANTLDQEDAGFHERARAEVLALHNRDESTLRAWRYIVNESRNHYMPIYRRLGVSLRQEDERGESFYADRLAGVVAELERDFGRHAPSQSLDEPRGLFPRSNLDEPGSSPRSDLPRIRVETSDGALCVFHETPSGEPMFKNPDGKPVPMIIRKSDGAYLYATTDLAAVQFRIRELGADRIIYVTDARQAQHFEMVFATARAAGWTLHGGRTTPVQLDHVTFGSILGDDRKPLKTRSGENVKLSNLLDEAVNRAEKLIRSNEADPAKRRGFSEDEIRDIAEAVGIGAVKYADLSQNRQSDYVFSWDKMLAMEGNTAPYMMYAYARIRSIYRKGAEESRKLAAGRIQLVQPAERALARQILRLPETLEGAAMGLRLNIITEYLYNVAEAFMSFYEACPVLKAGSDALRASRLRLCDLTARTLRIGLDLLGIRVVERM